MNLNKMKKTIFIFILSFVTFLVHAEDNETKNIFYEGPWEIEKLFDISKEEVYIYYTMPYNKHVFSISPNEQWLVMVISMGWTKYKFLAFNIPQKRLYDSIFDLKTYNDDYLSWEINCFPNDGSYAFIDKYMIPLKEGMESLTVKEEALLYEKVKESLTSLDKEKFTIKEIGRAYENDWVYSRDGSKLYEAIDYINTDDKRNPVKFINSKLRVTPPGDIKEMDYGVTIKEKVNLNNKAWLCAFDNSKSLFGRAVNNIDELSDDDLRRGIRNQDKRMRYSTERVRPSLIKRIFSAFTVGNEYREKQEKKLLEERLILFKNSSFETDRGEKNIDNYFKDKDIGDDFSKYTKEELVKMINDINDGLLMVKRGKPIEEMSRNELLRELLVASDTDIVVDLNNLSPAPDNLKMVAVLTTDLGNFGWGGMGDWVIINLNKERLKPIRFAEGYGSQSTWSDDSKRLYFCIDKAVYRLTLKETK